MYVQIRIHVITHQLNNAYILKCMISIVLEIKPICQFKKIYILEKNDKKISKKSIFFNLNFYK